MVILKEIFGGDRVREWIDIERIIHSTKTAIACILGILLARVVGVAADQWIVVTIVVVMCAQIYVGSVLQKAYFRFLGTVIGCLFAIGSLILAGDSFISIVVTMAISGFIFSYLATSNENFTYAGTLGAATTAIILLGPIHTVDFATQRFIEISAGILIATLVSQFVLPIHARSHIQRSQAKVLAQLRDYYIACLKKTPDTGEPTAEDLDENIIKSLTRQRQLAKEAVREPLGVSYDRKLFMQILQCEREILRSIDFMSLAKANIQNLSLIVKDFKRLEAFNDAIIHALGVIIRMMESEPELKEHIHLSAFTALKAEIHQNRTFATQDDTIYVDGFLFSAETLTNSLRKLAELNHIDIFEETKSTQLLPNR